MDQVEVDRRTIVKLTGAASVGTFMEWWDFFLALISAAIIWPSVFFSGLPVTLALFASLSSYASSYVVRPLGAYIFGHFGDKYGRRSTLLWTLALMGIGSILIAILPGNSKVGLLAPVVLFILRIVQGIGIGGEFGGAVSWITEYTSRSRWRTFWASLIVSTGILGIAVGLFSYTILFLLMPKALVFAYGWRFLFGIGALVLLVGGLLRYRFSESPLFKKLASEKKIAKFPSTEIFKRDWKKILALSFSQQYNFVTGALVTSYAAPYMISLGISSASATLYVGIAVFVAFFSGPLGGLTADKIGRKKTLIIGPIISILSAFPMFILAGTKVPILIILGLAFAMSNWFSFAVVGGYFSEQFSTKYRYSGTGLTYQFVSLEYSIIFIAIIAPVIALYPTIPQSWPALATIGVIFGIVSLVTLLLGTKERKVSDLSEISDVPENL